VQINIEDNWGLFVDGAEKGDDFCNPGVILTGMAAGGG
jgi:hypothetical protein